MLEGDIRKVNMLCFPLKIFCGAYVSVVFLARDSICRARYMLLPVRPSVRLTHGSISQKW